MKKILIADDNYEFSISLLNQLNQLEIDKTISIATDGKKVLNDIINNNIDLILLDLDLPNLTGLEILKILKEKKISIDVIVISGPNASPTPIEYSTGFDSSGTSFLIFAFPLLAPVVGSNNL